VPGGSARLEQGAGQPGRPQTSLPEHERVINAVRDRDPVAAEEAMRRHVASVIEALRGMP